MIDNIRLYFANLLGPMCSTCCFPKRDKFKKLYEEGEDKIESELNIVKIMKTLRDMKILLKGTLMNDVGTKFQVKHAAKNILNLDDTSDLEESDLNIDKDNNDLDMTDMATGKAPPKNLRSVFA